MPVVSADGADIVFLPGHDFPLRFQEEGLKPHSPNEVWVSLTSEPDVIIDVTDTWETKIAALLQHKSQIGDPDEFIERIKTWKTPDSPEDNPRYEERFRLIKWN